MNQKIGVAVVGTGNRGRGVVGRLLKDSDHNVRVAAVYDPDAAEMDFACEKWNEPDALRCKSSQEAVSAPGVDWVMVFSPNAFHKQHILEGFAAGKNVFSEKPLATSIEDCKAIYDAWKTSGRVFATGFVLRYANIYRKAKELLDKGVTIEKVNGKDALFTIAPADGSYKVNFGKEEFETYFKGFLRPQLVEMLF